MNTNIRPKDGVTVVDFEGRIIASHSLVLKATIDELISRAENGQVKMLINMAHVRMTNSSGLGIIVAAYTSVQRNGRRIALLNLGRNIKSFIVMSKLVTIFDRYDDEDDSTASFQENP